MISFAAMLRTNLIALTLILLAGCGSTVPKSTEGALGSITITHDKFNNSTSIETPLYLSRKGFTDTFPVQLKYKAFYKDSKREFIQLFVSISGGEIASYYEASGEDGSKLELVNIDSLIDSVSGIIVTKEYVGLDIPMEYLSLMGDKDFSIKIYGKRKSGDFVIPSSLTKAFIQKLGCFEDNSCT
jgi:hypothetical protein